MIFQNIEQSYTQTDATIEILLMLLGAFVLGFMFAWILKSTKREIVYDGSTEQSYTGKIQTHSQEQGKDTIPNVRDNISVITYLTPEMQDALEGAGVVSFSDIIHAGYEGIEKILRDAGIEFEQSHIITWQDQARLAQEGNWKELSEYQSILES